MSRKHTQKSSIRRLYLLLFIILLVITYYMYRLVKIQLIDSPELERQAINQWTKEKVTPSTRGNIMDRNGKLLAVNVTSFTVWAEPKRIDNKEEASIMLSPILEIPSEDIYLRLLSGDTVRKLKQWVSREEAEEIKGLGIKGISIVDGSKRYYPLDKFASDIIGFTNIDNEGLYGVEGYYDESLAGISGVRSIMTDAANRPLPDAVEKVTEAVDGYNLVLTVDETIQGFAEEAAMNAYIENEAKSVSIIVMDPHTGDILAMTNKPDYNPNEPRQAPTEEIGKEWSRLSPEDQQERWYDMWRNYAINDIYEPGSTYKLVTAAAALDSGKSSVNNHYYCDGYIKNVPGARLRCASWYNPHQDQTFAESFANSCNVAFVEMARQVGREGMIDYTKKFGFGSPTGIDMKGEQAGIIPRDPDMRESSLATLSYGHGIAVTPIQMVNAIAAIGNGGNLMKPRVAKRILDNKGEVIHEFKAEVKNRAVSKETADHILSMLEKTVLEGTGRRAYAPGYRVGGKTGTASKIIDGRYAPGKYIGSFGGIAPVDDPKIAILTIVDEPGGVYYGGTVAGPPTKFVIENTLAYLEVPKVYTDEELESLNTEIEIPNLVGMKIREAGATLRELGLKYTTQYELFTEDAIIVDHYPKQDSIVTRDSIVDLYLDSGERDVWHNSEAEGLIDLDIDIP